jgi:hypothetical protein
MLRQHPEFLTDLNKRQALQEAVNAAQQEGLERGTSEYKAFMYERLSVLPSLTQKQKDAAITARW